MCGWLMSLFDNGHAVDHCCGAENGHSLPKKKRPQEARPEAASISVVRVTVVLQLLYGGLARRAVAKADPPHGQGAARSDWQEDPQRVSRIATQTSNLGVARSSRAGRTNVL